jgi:ubiquinone/menaquinone biosynthesis C-methylase UbiE
MTTGNDRPEAAPPPDASDIATEFARRDADGTTARYDRTRPEVLFEWQTVVREVVALLRRAGLTPLDGRTVLDVGCGTGGWLAEFESWGAGRDRLAGIDVSDARAGAASRRLPGADIRTGDASRLPWADASFDIVTQFTMLSSVLDAGMRRAIAAEMIRVARPDGLILSYDFVIGNPRNRRVRGVRVAELTRLFGGCEVRARRVSLAPPLTRRLAPRSSAAAALVQRLRLLNTHCLAAISGPDVLGRAPR